MIKSKKYHINIKSKYLKKPKKTRHSVTYKNKQNQNGYYFKNIDLLNKNAKQYLDKQLIEYQKTAKLPVMNMWRNELNEEQKYIMYLNNQILGIISVQNKTLENCAKILGKYVLKSKEFNNNIYLMNIIIFKTNNTNDINSTTYIDRTNYINIFINKIKNILQMQSKTKNEFITLCTLLSNKKDFIYQSQVQMKDETNSNINNISNISTSTSDKNNNIIKYTLLKNAFKYNGLHIDQHDEFFDVYSIKFYPRRITINDYRKTYIITRQIESLLTTDTTVLKNHLNDLNLTNGNKNSNNFFYNNRFMYYNVSHSLYGSAPYAVNFIKSYLSNELGNTESITIYPILISNLIINIL